MDDPTQRVDEPSPEQSKTLEVEQVEEPKKVRTTESGARQKYYKQNVFKVESTPKKQLEKKVRSDNQRTLKKIQSDSAARVEPHYLSSQKKNRDGSSILKDSLIQSQKEIDKLNFEFRKIDWDSLREAKQLLGEQQKMIEEIELEWKRRQFVLDNEKQGKDYDKQLEETRDRIEFRGVIRNRSP